MSEFHHEDILVRQQSSRLMFWASVVVVIVVPVSCFLLAYLHPAYDPQHPEFSSSDVIAESILLVLFLVWILIIAIANLKIRTYMLLLTGFAFIAAAIAADVMDEFLPEDAFSLSVIENIAYPIGMFIASFGLWRWGQDYRNLLRLMNRDRLRWRARASYDDLTGQLNRRYFFDEVPHIIEEHQKLGRPGYLFMLDIDHFKTVNDEYGHPTGDLLLALYGEEITNFLRKDDLGFRLGGEEFALVIHDADMHAAHEAALRLKELLAHLTVNEAGQKISRSCSIGVSRLLPNDDIHTWLKRADQALYQAKQNGRDQVVMSERAG